MIDETTDPDVPRGISHLHPQDNHRHFMRQALAEARRAFDADEVPVGAVVVLGNRVLSRGHNQVETLRDPTAHAEMIALTGACEAVGNHRLEGAVLYVTLEPCQMCAGAAALARVERIVYGAPDPKTGACGTVVDTLAGVHLNHRVQATGGVLAEEAAELLVEFFRLKRERGERDRASKRLYE